MMGFFLCPFFESDKQEKPRIFRGFSVLESSIISLRASLHLIS